MKYINIFIVGIVINLSSILLLAQECNTKLIVKSDFSETLYYLNDTLMGAGSRIEIEVSPGVFKLDVIENSDRWNAKTITDTIRIKKCETLNLTYKLRSELLLRTEPDDAEVIINDSITGRTPLFLSYDANNVLLKKKGFADKHIKLSGIGKQDIINLDYIGTTNDNSFFQKDIFKILLGSIVVLGGTSAYFKIKADDKFEEYKVTGEGTLLNETRNYDLISGIIFGALQVNFGILIYHFLVE